KVLEQKSGVASSGRGTLSAMARSPGSSLVEHQQFARHAHQRRVEAMIDVGYRGIRHETPGKGELVLGQEGDEQFARRHGFRAFEKQLEAVARTGEGDAGPALFLVAEEARVGPRQREQGVAEMMARPTPWRDGGDSEPWIIEHGMSPDKCS